MKEYIKENKLTLLRLVLSVGLIVAAAILESYNKQASLVLYILSYALSSCLIITYAIINLVKDKKISEKMLMVIASVGAILVGKLFEATLIVVLFELGELVEDIAITLSRRSIKALKACRPKTVKLKGQDAPVKIDDVKVGDIVEVSVGESVPVDGVVVDSDAKVDASLITGSRIPKKLKRDKEALAGCLNLTNVLYIKATRTAKQSVAQRIIDMSRMAIDKKTKYEQFIRRLANIFTPVVVLVAVVLAIIPPFFDKLNFAAWIYRACAFVALSCPGALVLSVPLAYFSAMLFASRKGILIKNSAVLESLEDVNTIAFDKAGTLTNSVLRVIGVEAVYPHSKIDVLKFACIAELKSSHPIASAIIRETKKLNFQVSEGKNYLEFSGKGVECDSLYGHIKAGNKEFVMPGIDINTATIYISLNGKYVGHISIGDELKENSRLAFDRLRKLGVNKKIILSGDKPYKVDPVVRSLLADGAYSNLLPEYKLEAIEDIISTTENCKLAYCGDGTDDISSLERADIGIVMGNLSSDEAVNKGNVIIMNNDISKIPLAITIARKTKGVILENIIFALAVKAVFLVLATLGIVPLYVAVIADVAALMISLLNALRAGR